MSKAEHHAIWLALDSLAAAHGMSASGLAVRAGRDPTAFNKSKRVSKRGERHWPTMETVAAALTATGVSFTEFGMMVDANCAETKRTRK